MRPHAALEQGAPEPRAPALDGWVARMNDRLLTAEEIAEWLAVPASWVRESATASAIGQARSMAARPPAPGTRGVTAVRVLAPLRPVICRVRDGIAWDEADED